MFNSGNNWKKKSFTHNEVVDSIDLFSYDDQGLNKSESLICICQTNEEREEFTGEDLEDEEATNFDIRHLKRKLLNNEAEPLDTTTWYINIILHVTFGINYDCLEAIFTIFY